MKYLIFYYLSLLNILKYAFFLLTVMDNGFRF